MNTKILGLLAGTVAIGAVATVAVDKNAQEALSNAIDQVKENYEQFKNNETVLVGAYATLKDNANLSLEEANSLILAKNTQIAKLENEGAALRSELVQHMNTITTQSVTITNLEAAIEKLNSDITAGLEEISEVFTTVFTGIVDGLLEIQEDISNLEAEIMDLTSEVMSLEAMVEELNAYVAAEASRLEHINNFGEGFEYLAPMTPEELELFDGLLSSSIEDAEIGFLRNANAFFDVRGGYYQMNFDISESINIGVFQKGNVQVIFRGVDGNVVENKAKHWESYLNLLNSETGKYEDRFGLGNSSLPVGSYQTVYSKGQVVGSIELRVTNNEGEMTRKFFFNNHLN